MSYRLPEPRRFGEALELGERHGREGIDPAGWTQEDRDAMSGWVADDRHDYMVGYMRMQPAEAPPAWPVELVLIASETAMFAVVMRAMKGIGSVSASVEIGVLAGSGGMFDFMSARTAARRRRALELGLSRKIDEPRGDRPLNLMSSFMTAGLRELALRRRWLARFDGWELLLANQLVSTIEERWRWRRAGGPTRTQ